MVKKYNEFLVESINKSIENMFSLGMDMIINIIKSLKKSDDNDALVNKLINYSDKNGKTILMSISQSNNQDLIDFILKLDVDVEKKDKHGRNVLYYCKNLKTFNKFYNIVSDVNFIDKKTNKNLLSILASKNIFNVKIYKELIDKGLDINRLDSHGNTLLSYSITNYNIVKLLIDNGAKIDIKNKGDNFKKRISDTLYHTYIYFKFKRKSVINVLKILFNNGLNVKEFIYRIIKDVGFHDISIYIGFLKALQNYFNEDYLIELFDASSDINTARILLGLGVYPKLYKKIKEFSNNYWKGRRGINDEELKFLNDYEKKYPYLNDMDKFNL